MLPSAINVALALLFTKLRSTGTTTGSGDACAVDTGGVTLSVVWA